MATVKGKKHKESREHKRIEVPNSDRLINNTSFKFKEDSEIDKQFGDSTRESFTNELEENEHKFHTERLKEEEEFANVFYTTTFKFQEDDEFDRLFNNISLELDEDERFAETFDIAKGNFANKFEEPASKFVTDKFEQNLDIKEVKCPVLRGGCKQEEFDEFAQSWGRYAECQWEMDDRELKQQMLNCAVGPLENIMYNSLGSKLDTLSETDLMEELEKLAVMKSIAEQQDVNNPAIAYMENTAKPTSHKYPAQCSLTHRSPVHNSPKVHSQSFNEEKANDKVLAIQAQEDLVAEDQAEQDEARRVHPSKQEEDLAVHAEATTGNTLAHSGGDTSLACDKSTIITVSKEYALTADIAEATQAAEDSLEYNQVDGEDTVPAEPVKITEKDHECGQQANQDQNQDEHLRIQAKEKLKSKKKISTRHNTKRPASRSGVREQDQNMAQNTQHKYWPETTNSTTCTFSKAPLMMINTEKDIETDTFITMIEQHSQERVKQRVDVQRLSQAAGLHEQVHEDDDLQHQLPRGSMTNTRQSSTIQEAVARSVKVPIINVA